MNKSSPQAFTSRVPIGALLSPAPCSPPNTFKIKDNCIKSKQLDDIYCPIVASIPVKRAHWKRQKSQTRWVFPHKRRVSITCSKTKYQLHTARVVQYHNKHYRGNPVSSFKLFEFLPARFYRMPDRS
mmetsp:Transcript_16134/g.17946  ORF Transcript_16134/g.17946 Transcript_16134/m.17946 type:complete len:127 (+) Transcript_16134:341-721(+)